MLSRRHFLGASGALITGAPVVRSFGADEVKDKVRLAVIGVADRGAANLAGVATENIVALCEVDEPRAGKAREQFPNAKFFTDYRKMFDAVGKDFDAVVVSTPDHTHAHAALMGMRLGKHTYCEKPLAKSVHEVRLMQKVALEKKLVTQMGTQIHAENNYRRVVEIVKSGKLGTIKKVDVWCSRKPDGGKKIQPTVPVTFDINQWLGPVPEEFFYADFKNWPHFNWRWWWAFGGGTLQDMGCHFMDLAFWALDLGAPTSVKATGNAIPGAENKVPEKLQVDYQIPALNGRPAVHVTWYHGVEGPNLAGTGNIRGFPNGVLFTGEKGKLVADYGKFKLSPDEFAKDFHAPDQSIAKSVGHHREWLNAIRGTGKPLCEFGYAWVIEQNGRSLVEGLEFFAANDSIRWLPTQARRVLQPDDRGAHNQGGHRPDDGDRCKAKRATAGSATAFGTSEQRLAYAQPDWEWAVYTEDVGAGTECCRPVR